jgi:hypothetical protein
MHANWSGYSNWHGYSPAAARALALLLAVVFESSASAQSCTAQSAATPPAVVELYTSEGCSSCPPADRWLSALKGRRDVLALAFHVNYWDKLGWPDRFASPQITQRQRQLQRASGAPYVYTPQVIVNGADTPAWPGARLKPPAHSAVQIALVREGKVVKATVATGHSTAPLDGTLSGYWAVLEDGHSTRVRAGENAGETLLHDNVVTQYQPVPAWNAGATPHQLSLELASPTGKLRRVVFIVTDGAGSKPLQAAVLGC